MQHKSEQPEEDLPFGGLLSVHTETIEVKRVFQVIEELLDAISFSVPSQHAGCR